MNVCRALNWPPSGVPDNLACSHSLRTIVLPTSPEQTRSGYEQADDFQIIFWSWPTKMTKLFEAPLLPCPTLSHLSRFTTLRLAHVRPDAERSRRTDPPPAKKPKSGRTLSTSGDHFSSGLTSGPRLLKPVGRTNLGGLGASPPGRPVCICLSRWLTLTATSLSFMPHNHVGSVTMTCLHRQRANNMRAWLSLDRWRGARQVSPEHGGEANGRWGSHTVGTPRLLSFASLSAFPARIVTSSLCRHGLRVSLFPSPVGRARCFWRADLLTGGNNDSVDAWCLLRLCFQLLYDSQQS